MKLNRLIYNQGYKQLLKGNVNIDSDTKKTFLWHSNHQRWVGNVVSESNILQITKIILIFDVGLKLPEFLKNMRQVTWKPVKDSYIQVSTDNEFPCHYWRKEESKLNRKKVSKYLHNDCG